MDEINAYRVEVEEKNKLKEIMDVKIAEYS